MEKYLKDRLLMLERKLSYKSVETKRNIKHRGYNKAMKISDVNDDESYRSSSCHLRKPARGPKMIQPAKQRFDYKVQKDDNIRNVARHTTNVKPHHSRRISLDYSSDSADDSNRKRRKPRVAEASPFSKRYQTELALAAMPIPQRPKPPTKNSSRPIPQQHCLLIDDDLEFESFKPTIKKERLIK